jgi:hypothetical protein
VFRHTKKRREQRREKRKEEKNWNREKKTRKKEQKEISVLSNSVIVSWIFNSWMPAFDAVLEIAENRRVGLPGFQI